MQLSEITHHLEAIAPLHLAESWDNVGLLAGDPLDEIDRVLLCIDLTQAILDEAVTRKAQMIYTYHPPIFKPLSRVTAAAQSELIYRAIRYRVALYSPHTALDVAEGGTNDVLASLAGLKETDPLRQVASSTHAKLVVFIPRGSVESVSKAIFDAGAGELGDYSHCAFQTSGHGQFLGNSRTNPTIGQPNKMEFVEESRFETLVPLAKIAPVVSALRKAHPYEEPAFDLFHLHGPIGDQGIGRIGTLPRPEDRAVILKRLSDATPGGHILAAGPVVGQVSRIAVAAGAGGDLLNEALAKGAEMFITGEMRHHDALRAAASGMTVACLLHSNSERLVLNPLAQRLAKVIPGVECLVSKVDRDPFSIR